MKRFNEKDAIRPNLRQMAIGEYVSFPVHRSTIIRSTIHNLKDTYDMCFVTRKNPIEKILLIARTA